MNLIGGLSLSASDLPKRRPPVKYAVERIWAKGNKIRIMKVSLPLFALSVIFGCWCGGFVMLHDIVPVAKSLLITSDDERDLCGHDHLRHLRKEMG